ncbi:T9SS type A sorting domain-containing protein [Aureisphaera galaxeae]|uniref:T9SS type A sorting domain-containing protein n=1 Tax=Aureisphaera galaxeae TaxID=1538023 RepID=UPI00235076E4|nr:T9SS type A sorting domain-containing protein [Aureisphaera galaxeae]MDC8005402.1 T9SS type A sorting domain-containing protein [Aureisphaera galaxeae]
MKKKKITSITLGAIVTTIALIAFFNAPNSTAPVQQPEAETMRTSGAGIALQNWAFERAYPGTTVPISKYADAYKAKQLMEANASRNVPGEWSSLGPINIGGRTLCLAFHPTDEDIIYAGSASGGLWKTTTQGFGQDAWEYIPTGFPVLGVAAIAIDSNDPDTIIIGTGETYGVGFAEPGTVNRLTRGTYGIGILKTTDGGLTWNHVLQFNQEDIKGIQDVVYNPQNSQEVYAAATDGVYKSSDGGDTWTLIFALTNCIDIEIDPTNGDIIYVSHGNFNYGLDPNLSGIFKSTDGGTTFNELLDPGLITAWSGNAKLLLDPTNPNTLYASTQVGWFNTGATTPAGVFVSNDAGNTWTLLNNQNIAQFQGWYSHDFAINPNNTSEIQYVGVSAWKSTDGGVNFNQQSTNSWTLGQVSVEIPEGADNYVHSDIHGVYYHPINNKVFYATDGGVFISDDGSVPFTTLNGGLQTTQYYADMGSSTTDPNFLIAGAQDNASYIYRGEPSWWRVLGGDGMNASVNQEDDDIVYGSSQGLVLRRSPNNGAGFSNISPNLVSGDFPAFSAPFEIAPSDPNILYAGATFLYKATDGAVIPGSWVATSSTAVDVFPIMKIAISPNDPDLVYVTTSPDPTNGPAGAKIFKTTDGGASFIQLVNGLPNRICKDIEFDPTNEDILYAVFSGFGTDHVYKTVDAGATWTSIDNGMIPDVPANTILIDPLNPDDVYLGNDLGVYYSSDGGASWETFNEELPEAVMIYDLNDSPSNRMVRIATHGHGIWQRSYVNDPLAVEDFDKLNTELTLYPNPANTSITLSSQRLGESDFSIDIFSVSGQKIISVTSEGASLSANELSLDVSSLAAGIYLARLSQNGAVTTQQFIKN